MNILITGGAGFVGHALCELLSSQGHTLTVPTRARVHAREVGMLPRVVVVLADIHSPEALARLMKGQDAVIHLAAILHGSAQDFQNAHVTLTQKLLQAASAEGVKRFLHMSALGASAAGPSNYQRSKAAGQAAVQASGLAWTVFQPSVIFGADDKFLNFFARLQSLAPFVPLAGAQTKLAPVHVQDVARAMSHALADESSVGKVYEFTGPEVYTLADLVRFAGRVSGHPRPVFGIPLALGYAQAAFLKLAYWVLPGEAPLSADNIDSLRVDNVASGTQPSLADLGVKAQALSTSAPMTLNGNHPRSRFSAHRGKRS